MLFKDEIFREYDVRGVVDQDLDEEGAYHLGRAYAAFLKEQGSGGPVVVGRDNRASSPRLAWAVQRGLLDSGREVVDIGEVSTPIFYYSRLLYGLDGGVMVTASHNPPEFNGFKLALGFATIYGAQIQRLREILRQGRYPTGKGRREERDPVPAYLEMLREKIRLGPRRLRVVVDCGNGTMSSFAPRALESWGCEVIPLYCESDPRFPHHHPDPIQPRHLTDLIRVVRESGADLGVGYDGDGDRLGVVAEDGSLVWGDMLMILFWREILPKHPGATAIVEVKCSQALVEEIERLGGKPFFYRTGHSLIKAKMRELGAVFTGEMSGHMFFADEYYGYDDALYATGRLLRLLSHTEKSLSGLLADVPRYYSTAETRIPCPDGAKFRVVEDLVRRFRQDHPVIDVDGVRVLFPDGWGLVRASNTQPVLVARCESATPQGLERICRTVKEYLSAYPEVEDFRWE